MNIIETQGRLFTPGIIGEVPTGNLLWVDQVNGNDALAVRGRMTVPFKTLTAAKNAAQSGDTIVVLPGSYYTDGTNLAKNGTNWHFVAGAEVRGNAANQPIFKSDSSMNLGFKVSGHGQFVVQSGTYVLELAGVAHELAFEADSMLGNQATIRVTSVGNSIRAFIRARLIDGDAGPCISMAAGPTDGRVYVTAEQVEADANRAVDMSGGSLTLRAEYVLASAADAVYVTGGNLDVEAYRIEVLTSGRAVYYAGGMVNITAFEIFSPNTYAVQYANASQYTPVLNLRSARIVSSNTNAVYISAWPGSGYTTLLKLDNCFLKAGAGAPIAKGGGVSNVQVACYGMVTANGNFASGISAVATTLPAGTFGYSSSLG